MQQYLTPDCKMINPLFCLRNRDEMTRLYQTWNRMNWDITYTVQKYGNEFVHLEQKLTNASVYIKEQNMIFFEFEERFRNKYIGNRKLRIVTLLHLKPARFSPNTPVKWFISKQEDFYAVDEFIAMFIPFPFRLLVLPFFWFHGLWISIGLNVLQRWMDYFIFSWFM